MTWNRSSRAGLRQPRTDELRQCDAYDPSACDYSEKIRTRLNRRLLASIFCCVVIASACSSLQGESSDAGADQDGAPNEQQAGEQDTGEAEADEQETDGSSDSVETPDQDGDDQDGQDQNDSGPSDLGPENPSITERELTERLSQLPGTLAVGNGPELSVTRPDGAAELLLDGSESVLASQPTWSRDGTRLAWGSVSAERQAVLVQDFGEDGLPSGEALPSNAEGAPVFYLQWNGADERLVYIRNSSNRGLVEVGTVEPASPAVAAGEGAPFFISWGPETDRIVGHVNEQSIELYEVGDGETAEFAPVLENGGGFSAPAWADDARVLVVLDGQLQYLDVDTGETESIIEVPNAIRFVLSPDRTKIAYQTLGGSTGPELISTRAANTTDASLFVLDLATGDQTLVTEQLAVAWEWSPDNEKLAWLQASIIGGRPSGSWSFWSADGPLPSASGPDFNLSGKYGRNYLPFFAQYAQSVTGWAPDSSAFAFAGRIGRDGGIWIQLVNETVGPRLVTSGDFVTWGASDVPLPPTGGPSAA